MRLQLEFHCVPRAYIFYVRWESHVSSVMFVIYNERADWIYHVPDTIPNLEEKKHNTSNIEILHRIKLCP